MTSFPKYATDVHIQDDDHEAEISPAGLSVKEAIKPKPATWMYYALGRDHSDGRYDEFWKALPGSSQPAAPPSEMQSLCSKTTFTTEGQDDVASRQTHARAMPPRKSDEVALGAQTPPAGPLPIAVPDVMLSIDSQPLLPRGTGATGDFPPEIVPRPKPESYSSSSTQTGTAEKERVAEEEEEEGKQDGGKGVEKEGEDDEEGEETVSSWEAVSVPSTSFPSPTPTTHEGSASSSGAPSPSGSTSPLQFPSGIVRSVAWILRSFPGSRDKLLRALTMHGGADQGGSTSYLSAGSTSATQSSGSGSGNSQGGSGNKRPLGPSGGDRDKGKGVDRGPKRYRPAQDAVIRRLACPFHKIYGQLNPLTHCAMPSRQNPLGGYEDASRTKTHILKRHNPLRWCNNCWTLCSTEDEAQQHSITHRCSKAEECEEWLMKREQVEGFKERRFIRKGKSRGATQEAEKWYQLAEFLFPDLKGDGPDSIRARYDPYYEQPPSSSFSLVSEATGSATLDTLPEDQIPYDTNTSLQDFNMNTANPYIGQGFMNLISDFADQSQTLDPEAASTAPLPPDAFLGAEAAVPLLPPSVVPAGSGGGQVDMSWDNGGNLLSHLQQNNEQLRADLERCRRVIAESRAHASHLSNLYERLVVELLLQGSDTGRLRNLIVAMGELKRSLG